MQRVQISDLSFSYKGSDKLILKDINMNVEAGEFVCILGQSGCGKSTLLRLLAGLESCTTGEIKVGGQAVNRASLERGVVFQDYGLFPWMTAGENISLALKKKFPSWDKVKIKNRAIELLEAVGLDENSYKKYPKELSGGMKQRCAIASAFGIDPPILLMDEPFAALDAQLRQQMQQVVPRPLGAIGYANASGLPLTEALVKNRYVGRTFIKPTQEERELGVKIKLNPLSRVLKGKSIILVDDSIVRGTTSKQLVKSLRDAGAKEIHLRITSPPVKYSCYYGIDTPNRSKLIAANKNVEEIREYIGCDTLKFLDIEGMMSAAGTGNEFKFCKACFDGNYPVKKIDKEEFLEC